MFPTPSNRLQHVRTCWQRQQLGASEQEGYVPHTPLLLLWVVYLGDGGLNPLLIATQWLAGIY